MHRLFNIHSFLGLAVFNIDVTIEKSIETMQKLQFCALYISVNQLEYTLQRGTTSRKYTKSIIKQYICLFFLFIWWLCFWKVISCSSSNNCSQNTAILSYIYIKSQITQMAKYDCIDMSKTIKISKCPSLFSTKLPIWAQFFCNGWWVSNIQKTHLRVGILTILRLSMLSVSC